jgi:hypothetical protein
MPRIGLALHGVSTVVPLEHPWSKRANTPFRTFELSGTVE